MKYKYLAYTLLLALTSTLTQAQVKIGNNPTTITPGALLDIEGSTAATRTVSLPNGNFGIGTTNPISALDIHGAISFDNSTVNGALTGNSGVLTMRSGSYTFHIDNNAGTANLVSVTNDGDVGIGVVVPTAKLDVRGKVRIADGTQGAGKLLTSDAGGTASWQTLVQQNIPQTIMIGTVTGDYTVTPRSQPGVGGYGLLKDRLPLTIRPGSYPGYDAAAKQYFIQESAYYRIYAGSKFKGTSYNSGTSVRLYLYPFGVLQQFDDITIDALPVLSVFWEGFIPAGSALSISGYVFESPITNSNGALGMQSVIARESFLSITKLF